MVEIEYPPLKSFSLKIDYERNQDLHFSDMAEIERELQEYYSTKPKVGILPLNRISIGFGTVPIIYESEKKDQTLQIFNDCIIFTNFKYSRWKTVKERILQRFNKIKEKLGIDEINSVNLHYIDEFTCDKENFTITDEFNLNLNIPKEMELDYTDFHIGIKLRQDEANNYILKLRGVKNLSGKKRPLDDRNFYFKLESYYSQKVKLLPNEDEKLNKTLDLIASDIRKNFELILAEKMKRKIGYKE